MNIHVENLGKRFNREWIFKNFSYFFEENHSYAITGPNGSGKSTLLQVLAGIIPSSEGKLAYSNAQEKFEDDLHHLISITTPYQELIEEFTLAEFLRFHVSRKNFKNSMNIQDFAEKISLKNALDKEIRNFSSGMKQKVKLGLSLYANTPVILLDEPTTNLDSKAIEWYLEEINITKKESLLIVCSNQIHEYAFCDYRLDMSSYK